MLKEKGGGAMAKEREQRESLRLTMLSWFEQLNDTNKYIIINQCYELAQEQKREAEKKEKARKGMKIVKMSDYKRRAKE